jgi:hypothetical protein
MSPVERRLRTFIDRRRRAVGQSGAVLLAGLMVWTLTGGIVMAALLDMTTSSLLIAQRSSEQAQQLRAVDGALETAVAAIQIDPSGRVGLPDGKDSGGCAADLGDRDGAMRYDDGLGNEVLVTAACWGSTKKSVPHEVVLTARPTGPGAAGTAQLEVVAAKGPGNDVRVLGWSLFPTTDEAEGETGGGPSSTTTTTTTTTVAPSTSLPGTTTTTRPTTTTSTTASTTTTTTAPADGVGWTLKVTSEWQTGYCVNVTVTNSSNHSERWTVNVPIKGVIYSFWSAQYTRSGDVITASGESWNAVLRSGESTTFGWCTNY